MKLASSKSFGITVILALINVTIMAKQIPDLDVLEEQCRDQIEQNLIDNAKLSASCRAIAERYEKENNYNIASWYYLLAGEYQHNIHNIAPHITENFAFSNLAFSIALDTDNELEVGEYLKKYLRTSPVELSDEGLKSDASILQRILPRKNEKINNVIAKWEELSKKLLPIKTLLGTLQSKDSFKNPAKRIGTLLQVLDFQSEILAQNNMSIRRTQLALSDAYYKNKQYSESLELLNKLESSYQIDSQNEQEYVQWLHLMGLNYKQINDTEKTKYYFNKAVITAESVFQTDSLDLVSIYKNYAIFFEEIGGRTNALIYYEKLLSLYKQRGFIGKLSITPLQDKLAGIYSSIKQYPKAVELLKNSLSIKENKLGKDHLETAVSKDKLGLEYLKIGEYKKALKLFMEALEVKNNKVDKVSTTLAVSYKNIAKSYLYLNNLEQAFSSYRKAKKLFKASVGVNHVETVTVSNDLALVLLKQGKQKVALEQYLNNLGASEKVFGYNSNKLIEIYSEVGDIYSFLNKHQQALTYYEKALAIQERILGRIHNKTAVIYNKIGKMQQTLGRYGQAKEYYVKALRVYDKILGSEHPNIASSFTKIASLNLKLSNYSQALAYYNKALNIRKKVLGDNQADTGRSYVDLGDFYFTTKDYSKALKNYKQGLSIQEKQEEANKPFIAKLNNKIGLTYAALEEHMDAIKYYNTSLNLNKTKLGEQSIETAINYFNIGRSYQALDKSPKALEFLTKSLDIRVNLEGGQQLQVANTNAVIADIYIQDEEYSEALDFLLKVLEIRRQLLGTDHPKTISSYNAIASVYRKKEEYEKSLSFYTKALETQKKILTSDQIELSDTYQNLAVVSLENKNDEKAYTSIKASFDIYARNRNQIFSVLPPQKQNKYLEKNYSKFILLLEIAEKRLQDLGKSPKSNVLLKELANAWLSYKGNVFDDVKAMTKVVNNSSNKHVKSKAAQLQTTKNSLLELYQTIPEPKERKAWSNNIAKFKRRIGILNDAIANSEYEYKQQLDLIEISTQEISSLLDDDALYVDYYKTDQNYFVLAIGKNNNTNLIKLSKKATDNVNEIVRKLGDDVNDILKKKLNNLSKSTKKSLAELYKYLLSKPLGKIIKKKKSLMLSLDGDLKSFPFEVLYIKENKDFLMNKKLIQYYLNGKELIRLLKNEETLDDKK